MLTQAALGDRLSEPVRWAWPMNGQQRSLGYFRYTIYWLVGSGSKTPAVGPLLVSVDVVERAVEFV